MFGPSISRMSEDPKVVTRRDRELTLGKSRAKPNICQELNAGFIHSGPELFGVATVPKG